MNVTGKRRIAFAAHVDPGRLAHLPRLLRSLALSNPGLCEDFLVLHQGLAEADLAPARRLHPRIVARATTSPDVERAVERALGQGCEQDGEQGGEPAYDTVIALDVTEPVRQDLASALRERRPLVRVAAKAPDADGEPGAPHPAEDAATDREFYAAYCALPGPRAPELLLHCARPLLDEPATAGGRPGGPREVDRVALARAVGSVLYQQGRYDEAVEVLTPAARDPRRPRVQETLGSALMAVSRYDEAETHLLLAAADPAVAPRAHQQLARLAWLRGDDAAAHAHARRGLDADPTDAVLRTLHRRTAPRATGAAAERATAEPDEQVAHVALFSDGRDNSGDKVLPEAVRRCFGTDTGPARWHSVPVHRLVTDAVLAELNARRGVIVGGGGLFLPDTWPNGNSGWQWNIPEPMIHRITPPLAVFAVGFNVFDGQHYAAGTLAASLRAVVDRAAFFGLRNRGSVERVRELLPRDLRDRVRYQPCPTTVMRHLLPDWRDPAPHERSEAILLNCAYDRAGLRFGHDYGHFLGQLAEAVRRLAAHGEVRYAPHSPSDERFVNDLRREHGLTIPVEPLYDLPNDELLDVYRRARLVIGMRGHATMIPFGCGTPAISLVSHPKMAYFLADVERPAWGVSVHAGDLAEQLLQRAEALLSDHEAAVADVHDRQRELLRVTRENAAELAKLFDLPPA
ncbi:polysaccharide pyruvyl transferase family protein [Streptomyces sp. 4N509B]|uniref:polysaccharide pyruvyl transferase family protein n=1 Tax=Streptomyces sp. 4N509B TaxID=3457413 RepID=UPI003FD168E0